MTRGRWATIAMCLLMTAAGPALAQTPAKKHHFAVGTEISHIKYEEPGVMENEGILYGLVGSYTYRQGIMARAEGKLAYGELDYTGSTWGGTPLTIDNIPTFLMELRGTTGYDFPIGGPGFTLTPYLGLGYRWLNDHSQRRYTGGYERESNYLYAPIGLEASIRLGQGWRLDLTGEYDLFIWGRQISRLSDVNHRLNDVENDQDGGYGLRGSLRLSRMAARVGFAIEPYIRYWDIDRSDLALLTDGNEAVLVYEPDNRSTEIGLRFTVLF